ncbi:cyclic peptide export ABC transporter [Pseudoalteromonas sp. SMS1]|uniref:cyclic peptide export ABC transporter n=1 Tax=Pseudoalteromonas sp. SMS1 TaxID=2908894 RepID=UPI001F359929|nr:cyclic peptide export ABC transporter [Pseudoalteromonas sp. SMS1]MCF2859118.1 cyclic peptide export ABC transporter [Pseudoalteromonas sp. SMS1]
MFLELVYKFKYRILLSTLLGGASAILSLYLIDEMTNMANGGDLNDPSLWLVKILCLIAVFFAMSTGSSLILNKMSVKIVQAIQEKISGRVLNTQYNTIEKMGKHKILATFTSDVNDIASAISAAPNFIYNLLVVFCCFIYLAYTSIELFMGFLVTLAIGFSASYYVIKVAYRNEEKFRDSYDVMHDRFKTIVDGMKELQTNQVRRSHFYNVDLVPTLRKTNSFAYKSDCAWSISQNWGQCILFIILSVIAFINLMGYSSGEQFLKFVFVIVFLIGPFDFLLSSQEQISSAIVSLKKIGTMELAPKEQIEQVNSIDVYTDWDQITFSDLSYKYNDFDEGFEFGPLSLEIKRNELIFIKGGNGSGKSTFIKLLTGLFIRMDGQIHIDDKLVGIEDYNRYKNLFSVIHSDFYLFNNVIDKKSDNADDEEIRVLLKKLKLDEKVTVSNGKFSTTNLSHGQRKRLALIISLFEDSEIYVFDEWAADQDKTFRDFFYQYFLKELQKRGKTLIVISHDLEYFDNADRVLEFKDGNLWYDSQTDAQSKGAILEPAL